jgi:hypothetical protein
MNLGRRSFLKITAKASGAFVLGIYGVPEAFGQAPPVQCC